jgi:hypothetical protein
MPAYLLSKIVDAPKVGALVLKIPLEDLIGLKLEINDRTLFVARILR